MLATSPTGEEAKCLSYVPQLMCVYVCVCVLPCLHACVYAYCTCVSRRTDAADRFCMLLLKPCGWRTCFAKKRSVCVCVCVCFPSFLLCGKQIVRSNGLVGWWTSETTSSAWHLRSNRVWVGLIKMSIGTGIATVLLLYLLLVSQQSVYYSW